MNNKANGTRGTPFGLRVVTTLMLVIGLTLESAQADVVYNPIKGWNLIGNSSDQVIDVAGTFGDSTKVASVWKWNLSQGKWAFYTPALSSAELATYTQANGYLLLSRINPKEGFWVNAVNSFNVTVPSSVSLKLSASDFLTGWNLVSSAENNTPSQLSSSLSSSLSAAGRSILSYWGWSTSDRKWRFYAPSLNASGGLAAYIASYSYLPFTSPLTTADGLWVNVSGGTNSSNLFSQPANPINLKLTLDATTKAVSAMVPSIGGGTLTTTSTNGTSFQLNIPDGALAADTQITMTPVTSISNLPLNGLGGAVKLDPEGLFFYKDVTLTIKPTVAIPVTNQVLFGFSGSGTDMILATPPKPFNSAIQVSLRHFSGAGVGNGVSEQKAAVLSSIANNAESRLVSEMGAALASARADALNGGSGAVGMAKLTALLSDYESSVVQSRIAAATASGSSCGDATSAVQTVLGYERQRQLLGLQQSSAYSQLSSLLNSGTAKCREEKIAECQSKNSPDILKSYDYSAARQQALLGISNGSGTVYSDTYYKDTCSAVEWTGVSRVNTKDTSGFEWQYTTSLTFVLDKTASTSTKQVFKVGSGTVNATIPSAVISKCNMSGATGSHVLLPDEGGLTVDLTNNTYQGGGYLAAGNPPLVITMSCPGSGSFSYDASANTPWFWADDMFRPLASDGKSFQATRTLPGHITMTADWTFTRP
jgi:hypothetical protein